MRRGRVTFRTAKLPSNATRIGRNWSVVKVNSGGNKCNIAYCKTERAALEIEDAMNAVISHSENRGGVVRTTFTFAGRIILSEHKTFCGALHQAQHTVSEWKAIPSVVIHGERHEGDPYIGTVTTNF